MSYSGGSAEDRREPLAYVVTDSRGNNFDNGRIFNQPGEFLVKYCIVRGATVKKLQEEFLELIKAENINQYFPIIVKIAVGINNFTILTENKFGTKELFYSGVKADDVFLELLEFKQVVKEKIHSALIGFITVPPVSLRKFREYSASNQPNNKYEQSEIQLANNQKTIESEIEILNSKLSFENCEKQDGHLKGCRTISWHNSVWRLSKVKRGKKYKYTYKADFRELYDGLHGTSTIKHKWFEKLVTTIKAEISYTKSELYTRDSGDSEDTEERTWDFKRKRLDVN